MTHDGHGSERPRTAGVPKRTRRAAMIAIPIASLVLVLAILPNASAEGPGYGGTADKLSVSWTTTASPGTAVPPPAPAREPKGSSDVPEPNGSGPGSAAIFHGSRGSSVRVVARASSMPAAGVTASGLSLSVGGVGFRGLSAVRVRVGTGAAYTGRADATGTLQVLVPVASDTEVRAGMSVVALGNAPSGTSMTLVGSIPPRPLGKGPVDVVPWFVAAILLATAASWLLRRVGSSQRKTALVPSASP